MQSTERVRPVASDAEREEVYRLRYQVYVEELRYPHRHADHARKTISDPLDAASIQFVGLSGGEIAAAVRLTPASRGDVGSLEPLCQLLRDDGLQREEIAIGSNLVVHPDHRGGLLAVRLLVAVVGEWLRIDRSRYLLIVCGRHLVRFYERFGGQIYRDGIPHTELGAVAALLLDTTDIEHLSRVRSPLLAVCQQAVQARKRSVAA